MAAGRRPRLAKRRRHLGFTQESLAVELGVDRSTIARWERGRCVPQPHHRARLCDLLQVSRDGLDDLFNPEGDSSPTPLPVSSPQLPQRVIGLAVAPSGPSSGELDDMNRRELLRLLTVTGTLVALPAPASAHSEDMEPISEFDLLNSHLWQVFALASSKRAVYPAVHQQLDVLTGALRQPHSQVVHERLCMSVGDLFQLAGEIMFDANMYTDAAHCYTLAADASREARNFDRWACALVRHAYVSLYERDVLPALSLLDSADRVARRGDSRLSTRYWVAAVRAEAYAGLGEFDACKRELDVAEGVRGLPGPVMPGGWLRFDGSRLAEGRGTCYTALGRPDLASVALTEALESATSLRRRGSILTDLAVLGARTRELDQALEYGVQAADLADKTRSSGYVGRKLHALQGELRPLLTDHRAAQLSSRISQLEEAV
ncbi:helix-turn-helix domain-containing protein [Actinomadura harenae]|uniref:Helix-turn-helix domain-containing protein n=1 Tax=Actinomadura harenae TaxID=2483351 RepID=A0A3M2M0Z0_9ACTN|nr:helix-turn-helix domain-containing protein [Actinomadura harenae]RMI43301.1 helix-turn-helix domain-containing protein [Actinomadura harenae]